MISLTMPDSSQRNALHHANTWVDDITVVTHVAQDCNHASVDWQVVANGDISVELRDADRQVVATGQGTSGTCKW